MFDHRPSQALSELAVELDDLRFAFAEELKSDEGNRDSFNKLAAVGEHAHRYFADAYLEVGGADLIHKHYELEYLI